jgi:hypothetical protein
MKAVLPDSEIGGCKTTWAGQLHCPCAEPRTEGSDQDSRPWNLARSLIKTGHCLKADNPVLAHLGE